MASAHANAHFPAHAETDRADEGWHQSLRAQKKQAKEQNLRRGGEFSAYSQFPVDNQPKRWGLPVRRRPPPVPEDDLKVVFRPHQGLPLRNATSQAISDAIVEACLGKIRWDQFILRIRPGSNIAVASTPDMTVATAMRGVTSLKINGRPHTVNVYATPGDGTRKGVIDGIEPQTPPETIKANICFRTQGVELVEARMLGNTQSAVLTFLGAFYRDTFTTEEVRSSAFLFVTRSDSAERVGKLATATTYARSQICPHVLPAECATLTQPTNVQRYAQFLLGAT